MTEPFLFTERLAFRLIVESDLDFLASMLGDREVMQHYPKVMCREESREWLEKILRRYQEDGHAFWLMQNRQTGESIGQMGLLKQQVDGVDEKEIGYMLHRSFWRQGFAAEGAAAVRDYAFGKFDCTRLISLIRPVNIPSQRVALSYGAKPEKLVKWREYEHLVFSLSRTCC